MAQEGYCVEPHSNELILELRDIFSRVCRRRTDNHTTFYLKDLPIMASSQAFFLIQGWIRRGSCQRSVDSTWNLSNLGRISTRENK
jgi:hypothetical protein